MRENCKCDYCGHHDYDIYPGQRCPKCNKGVMCANGSNGWPGTK